MNTKHAILLFLLLLMCGCYDKFGDYKPEAQEHTYPNMLIEDVRALYKGKPAIVNRDVVIAGYVSANDRQDNFYKTIVIDDGTGAIEVKAGVDYLFNLFPEGSYVAVRASGLTVGSYNGVLQIGLAAHGDASYQVEYFGHRAVVERYVFCERDMQASVAPIAKTIDQLTEDLCGRLVRIEGVTATALEEQTWAIPRTTPESSPASGYRIFADVANRQIAVQTSGYADFASEVVPSCTVSVTGILMHGKTDTGKTMFMLKMRSLYDVEQM